MPRLARVVAAGVPHHVTQRGNNRQDVFLADSDRRSYLRLLREDSQHCGVRLLAYCLMSNHVHLVAVPDRPDSLARALRRTHSRYAQQFNRLYGHTGHLWQNRFFSCPLDRNHLLTALAYVELNPVRAGLVGQAQQFPWSSAREHIEGPTSETLLDWELWKEIPCCSGWAETMADGGGEAQQRYLRSATYAGLPCGGAEFVRTIERQFGRRLRPQKPGPKVAATRAGYWI
jgi:putative transposase